MAGYSDKALWKKLGIKDGMRLLARGAPPDYLELLGELPPGASVVADAPLPYQAVHLFCTSQADLAAQLHAVRGQLAQDGMVWVSWPKKTAKVPTDIGENTIRAAALPLGFVDTKVCAVDAVWSGLKLVIRVSERR